MADFPNPQLPYSRFDGLPEDAQRKILRDLQALQQVIASIPLSSGFPLVFDDGTFTYVLQVDPALGNSVHLTQISNADPTTVFSSILFEKGGTGGSNIQLSTAGDIDLNANVGRILIATTATSGRGSNGLILSADDSDVSVQSVGGDFKVESFGVDMVAGGDDFTIEADGGGSTIWIKNLGGSSGSVKISSQGHLNLTAATGLLVLQGVVVEPTGGSTNDVLAQNGGGAFVPASLATLLSGVYDPAGAAAAAQAASQPLDSDLTTIAGLTATTDHFMVSVSSSWASRTPAQAKTTLAIVESDVSGLVSDLAAKAPIASPALTGTPTAPTPAAADNSTKLATTAYVDAAYTSYTPAVSQSSVPTQVATVGRYKQVGRHVTGYATVTIGTPTTGTAGVAVAISLPVAMSANVQGTTPLGQGEIYDSSAGILYSAPILLTTATAAVFARQSETAIGFLGVVGFTAALASGDLVSIRFDYEAA